jgi:hypothetical protein
LFANEAVIWLVVVERLDHPIAVAPGIGIVGVEFKSGGIGIAHKIEPVTSHSLSVTGRGQQAVHDLFIRINGMVVLERLHLHVNGWKAREIEIHATEPVGSRGLRGRAEVPDAQSIQDERVDGRTNPRVGCGGRSRMCGPDKGPPLGGRPGGGRALIGPGRAGVDPLFQHGDLLRG